MSRIAAVACLAVMACGLALPARAQDASVLILDASGSMAAAMGGETRLDAARRVLIEDIAKRPPGTSLALVAYGHRRAGDCRDIETVAPMRPIDMTAIRRDLARLRARGKTPLSASLRHAAALLPPEGGTILLVSDGLETCKEDPCAVARDLRAAHANVRISVIGFGLAPKEAEALACIAEQGGGLLESAGDAQQLSQALSTVATSEPAGPATVSEAPASPVVPVPAESEPPPTPEPSEVPVSFVAVAQGENLLAGVPLGWTVTAKDETKPLYEGSGEGIALSVKPGTYTVVLKGANASSSTAVTVDGPTPDPVKVMIPIGRLRLTLVAGNTMSLEDFELAGDLLWRIEPRDGQGAVIAPMTDTPDLALAPGRYAVSVAVAGRQASAEVTVGNGQRTDAMLSLKLGRLTLEAAMDDKTDPIDGGTELSWRLASESGGNPVAFDAIARPVAVLPAGRYRVTLLVDGAEVGAEAIVVDGESRTTRLTIGAGTVTLEGALGPGGDAFTDWRDAQWTVTPVRVLGGAAVGAALKDHAEGRPVLTLMPGEWEARLVTGAAKAMQRFRVQPGGVQTVRLEQAAARLRIVASSLDGELSGTVLLSVFGPQTESGMPATPLFEVGVSKDYAQVVPAGRYRITAAGTSSSEKAVTGETSIELKPGDSAMADVVLK